VKDRRAAFQSALAAADRTAAAAVWTPAGDYRVLGHVTMPQRGAVALHGAGPWHSTLRGGGTNPTVVGTHATAASVGGSQGMGLFDLAIVGDGPGRPRAVKRDG
jgi:hypothetical protein